MSPSPKHFILASPETEILPPPGEERVVQSDPRRPDGLKSHTPRTVKRNKECMYPNFFKVCVCVWVWPMKYPGHKSHKKSSFWDLLLEILMRRKTEQGTVHPQRSTILFRFHNTKRVIFKRRTDELWLAIIQHAKRRWVPDSWGALTLYCNVCVLPAKGLRLLASILFVDECSVESLQVGVVFGAGGRGLLPDRFKSIQGAFDVTDLGRQCVYGLHGAIQLLTASH